MQNYHGLPSRAFIGNTAADVVDYFTQLKLEEDPKPYCTLADVHGLPAATRHLAHLTHLNIITGVIIVAATNHMALLDPAMIRSGRFDRRIAIAKPGKKGTADILKAHSQL